MGIYELTYSLYHPLGFDDRSIGGLTDRQKGLEKCLTKKHHSLCVVCVMTFALPEIASGLRSSIKVKNILKESFSHISLVWLKYS